MKKLFLAAIDFQRRCFYTRFSGKYPDRQNVPSQGSAFGLAHLVEGLEAGEKIQVKTKRMEFREGARINVAHPGYNILVGKLRNDLFATISH